MPEILEQPRFLFAGLDIRLGLDVGQIAELPETNVGTRSTTDKDWIVGAEVLRHDALNVAMNGAIHRSVESLPGLHPAIEDPSPA